VLLFSFITPSTSYFAFTFPGMILYLLGIGCVYFTSNVVIVSAASKSDQGAAAAVFNVAVQVGGSVLGLAILTAVAQGVTERYGDGTEKVGEIGYRAVYYSCVILCAVGFLISVFGIEVPGKNTGAQSAAQDVAGEHEMVPVEDR
jgi:sugar phosphate permease